ncbi:hypothetical protein IAT38_004276 [Cryptococcus sp. DSM 104549]
MDYPPAPSGGRDTYEPPVSPGDKYDAGAPPPRDSAYAPRGRSRSPPRRAYADSYDLPPRRDDVKAEYPPAGTNQEGGYKFERPDTAPPARAERAPPKADPNNVIGVFGLSIRTRERDLEDEFSRFGEVEKVVIVYDQRTDRSRGFGFITMRATDQATRAIDALNGYNLHGRKIRVDYSATSKPHASTPGEYMGVKRTSRDDGYGRGDRGGDRDRERYPRSRYDDRRDDDRRDYDRRYDDRRGSGYADRDREYVAPAYDDRDRGSSYRDRDPYVSSRRDREDPYGGRSRRDDYASSTYDYDYDKSRRNRYSASPERAPRRDYPPPAEMPRY